MVNRQLEPSVFSFANGSATRFYPLRSGPTIYRCRTLWVIISLERTIDWLLLYQHGQCLTKKDLVAPSREFVTVW